jgi:hypothetical protein
LTGRGRREGNRFHSHNSAHFGYRVKRYIAISDKRASQPNPKAAPEEVERWPSSKRVAIENWAKQQKDSPPARRPFAARAWLALDAMPCCYWNLWLFSRPECV